MDMVLFFMAVVLVLAILEAMTANDDEPRGD